MVLSYKEAQFTLVCTFCFYTLYNHIPFHIVVVIAPSIQGKNHLNSLSISLDKRAIRCWTLLPSMRSWQKAMAIRWIGFTIVVTYALPILLKRSTGGKKIVLWLPICLDKANLFATLYVYLQWYIQSADLNIENSLHHVLYYLMVKIVPHTTCHVPVQMRGS